jgi:hypothetical protein
LKKVGLCNVTSTQIDLPDVGEILKGEKPENQGQALVIAL